MADDAGILQQALDVALAHVGDAGDVEAVEDFAEAVALPEDGDPGEAGLEAFEAELLEEPVVGGDRTAPFVVVVGDVERVGAGPGTA